MNRIETLLCVLAEECAEVAQRCSKAQRFGAHQIQADHELTNADRIGEELNDLYALVEMIGDEIRNPWFGARDKERIKAKRLKVESYMAAATPAAIAALDREDVGGPTKK